MSSRLPLARMSAGIPPAVPHPVLGEDHGGMDLAAPFQSLGEPFQDQGVPPALQLDGGDSDGAEEEAVADVAAHGTGDGAAAPPAPVPAVWQ